MNYDQIFDKAIDRLHAAAIEWGARVRHMNIHVYRHIHAHKDAAIEGRDYSRHPVAAELHAVLVHRNEQGRFG